MLIKMNKQDFDLLTDDSLSQGCFRPLIQNYKSRVVKQSKDDDSQMKENFYKELNEGQRALFMFYTYYNHANKSFVEFYWWSAYFFAQPKIWSALKASMKYFEEESLLLLLEMIEIELKRHNHPDTLEHFKVTRDELNRNQQLKSSIKYLHNIFEKTSPLTISKIDKYIEKNLHEFVEIEN